VLATGGGLYLSSISVRPVATALEAQRRFTADAAHELRTPVSVIRAAADVTLTRDHREEAEYREAFGIIAGQARGLGRLVDSMLVLARADAGAYAAARQPVSGRTGATVPSSRRGACSGAGLRSRRMAAETPSAATRICFGNSC
jgi:signal transduction histidine kinase